MVGPALIAYQGVEPIARLDAPSDWGLTGGRAWTLAVMAVQVRLELGAPQQPVQIEARLRSHSTGGSAVEIPLEAGAVVHVALISAGARVELPMPPAPAPAVERARLEMFVGGRAVGAADAGPVAEGAPLRSFGHVFCRHQREGAAEAGADLTNFLHRPIGQKYERQVSLALSPGDVVSYRLLIA